MRLKNSGMALIDTVIVLAVTAAALTIGSGIAVTQAVYRLNAENIHESEALAVYQTVEQYLYEAVLEGTIDNIVPYEAMMAYPLGDERNGLYDSLKDICPKEAKIVSMSVNRKVPKVNVLVYSAGGYVIKIRNGRTEEIVKTE